MFDLISTINVGDVDAFVAGVKSAPQEHLDGLGVVEQTIYRGVGENVVIIAGTYKTLEDAQNHKAILGSSESEAQLKQMGVKSFDIWLAEKA